MGYIFIMPMHIFLLYVEKFWGNFLKKRQAFQNVSKTAHFWVKIFIFGRGEVWRGKSGIIIRDTKYQNFSIFERRVL